MLNVSFLASFHPKGNSSGFSCTLLSERRQEGECYLMSGAKVKLRPRDGIPQTGLVRMGASFGRAEQEENHVRDVLGSRRSMHPTGSPGKASGWAGNSGLSGVLRPPP